MITKASVTAQSWGRLTRWVAAASVVFYSVAGPSPAVAANPAWWDCNYGFRKQITVTAGSAVSSGHSVTLTFNHAGLVPAKSLASGNDVRVLYWTGAAWVELDRVLDLGSSWNNSATKIWFKLQAGISASSSDGNYYLYYGNPSASTPPSSWTGALIFYDGFESGNLNAWSGSATTAGDTIAAVNDSLPGQNGTFTGKAVTDTTPDPVLGYSYGFAWKNFTGQNTVYAKLKVYLPPSFPSAGTNDVVIMEFNNGWSNIISLTINAEDRTLFMWKEGGPPPGPFGYNDSPSTPLTTGMWHTIEMMATASTTAGEARVWLNGSLEIEATGQNLGSNPIDKVSAGIYYSIPEDKANTIYIDDVFVRSWVSSESTTSLGTELAQDCTGFPTCNYQYRQKITITAGSSAVPSGYTVSLTFNHASLVGAGKSLPSGNDIRIIYASGTGGVELDRVLDPGSSWGNTATRIWFKTQAAIGASSSDANYYLYYNYPGATSPPASPSNVFLFYDGFESGNFSAWTSVLANDAGDTLTNVSTPVFAGTRSARAIVGAPTPGQAAGEKNISAQQGLHTTIWVRLANWDGSSTADVSLVQYYRDWTTQQGSLTIRADTLCAGVSRKVLLWMNSAGQGFCGTTQMALDTWYRLEMKVWRHSTAGRAEVWVNGVREINQSTLNTGSLDTNKFLAGIFWKGNGIQTLYVDEVFQRLWVDPEPTVTLSSEETVGAQGSYFTPDAAAAGMNVPVTFAGDICVVPTITTSSSDIIVGPKIVTDANGTVVTENGRVMSTVFFIKPEARPGTAITVYANGQPLAHTFNIVIPSPDPNGGGTLSGRTKRGTKVLGGLTVPSGTLSIDTSTDTDTGTAGNQGYLPAVILVKGDVNIAGTLEAKTPGATSLNGANGAAGGGGGGGVGGAGGGGGGGGGAQQNVAAAGGGAGFSGGGGGGSKGTGSGGAGGSGTGAAGSAASGTTGGTGGVALSAATGGGAGVANTLVAGGGGGGGGTGNPLGTGGYGGLNDGGPAGKGGGGGGAADASPGGGGGGTFATAGGTGTDVPDSGAGGIVTGNAQLVPLAGGSGGGGGGADSDIASVGGGGGGAGGAVLIYATGSVTISGTIAAVGGNGGNGFGSGAGGGGGGSGGAIILQSGTVSASGTLTTLKGNGGTPAGSPAGGAGGDGRIRIDGLATGGTVPGTAGSKFIGPVIDKLVGTTVTGRAEGGSTVTLYVYDSTGAQVSGSPYTTTATAGSGASRAWTIPNVTFPSGAAYLAVTQTTSGGDVEVFGPGLATKGIHVTNWREVY
ncbi:MAG: heparin lyase I family protein [Candidatus Methylomirabilales bacterium]